MHGSSFYGRTKALFFLYQHIELKISCVYKEKAIKETGSKNIPHYPLPHTTNKIKIHEIGALNKNYEINLKGRWKHALLAAKVLHKLY